MGYLTLYWGNVIRHAMHSPSFKFTPILAIRIRLIEWYPDAPRSGDPDRGEIIGLAPSLEVYRTWFPCSVDPPPVVIFHEWLICYSTSRWIPWVVRDWEYLFSSPPLPTAQSNFSERSLGDDD